MKKCFGDNPGRTRRRALWQDQGGFIELGTVLVVLVILGIIVCLQATGTTWSGLSWLGKGVALGAIAVSGLVGLIFNKSLRWP